MMRLGGTKQSSGGSVQRVGWRSFSWVRHDTEKNEMFSFTCQEFPTKAHM